MKLHTVRIDGFAGLSRGTVRLDDGKACLLMAETESAQRDWVRCVTALFYDFQCDDGSYDAESRTACAPARGGPYACEIDFSTAAGRFRLSRDFAARTVRLEEAASGQDVAEKMRGGAAAGVVDLGTKLLGLGRADFLRLSGFAHVAEAGRFPAESFRRELERAIVSDEAAAGTGAALAALSAARQGYRDAAGLEPSLPADFNELTAILRIRAETADAELRSAADEAAAPARLTAEIERLEARIRERRAELEAVGGEAAWVEHVALERSMVAHREACDRLARFLPERDRLAFRRGFPVARRDEFRRVVAEAASAAERVQLLEARAAELDKQLREQAVPEAGDATDEQLRDLGGPADRLESARRGAETARRRLDAAAGVQAAFLKSFSALPTEEQDFCRAAGPSLRRLEAERTAARARFTAASESLEAARGRRRALAAAGWVTAAAAVLPLPFAAAKAVGLWEASTEIAVAAAVQISVAGAAAFTLACAGALMLWRARVVQRGTVRPSELETADAGAEAARIERDCAELRERLRRPAGRMGIGGSGELLARIESLAADPVGVEGLGACRELSAATEELARVGRDLRLVLKTLGRTESADAISPADVRALSPQAQALLERRRLRSASRERLLAARRELPVQWAAAQAARESFVSIGRACGLDASLEPGTATAAFEAAAAEAERFVELSERLIPAAEKNKLPEDEVVRRSRRIAERTIDVAVAGRLGLPADAGAARIAAAVSTKLAEIAEATAKIESLRKEAAPLWLRGPGRVAAAGRRRDAAAAELRRAERFDASLRMAAETLERSRSAVLTAFLEKLNTLSTRIVPTLVPGYAGLRFTADLSFALRQSDGRLIKPEEFEQRLGPGVRERAVLAVKLTAAEALAAGAKPPTESVPLFVEEPPTADDARRSGAMLSLLGVTAGKRQVCILSSGRKRNESRLREDPAFRNRLQLLRI
jgi:hypothetical protein